MIDYTKEFGEQVAATKVSAVSRLFKLVYGWMGAGLALSGLVAWYTFTSGLYEKILTSGGMMICVVAELGLVWFLGSCIDRLSSLAATALFLGYAALNGLTLSVVFIAYEIALVQNIFFITAGMFAGLAVWGTVTKSDLSGVGSFCGMALWGLIIALFVNVFLGSSRLDFIVSFAGILIFTGLTMYDAQKIRTLADNGSSLTDAQMQKYGILGALTLYLDFVNLFLYLLRFFGRKR